MNRVSTEKSTMLERYQKLCEEADGFLTRNLTQIRVSMKLFHVQREHPVFLKDYGLASDEPHSFIAKNKTRHYKRSSIGKMIKKIKELFSRPDTLRTMSEQDSCDIFLISHFLNKNQLLDSNDLYFGNLANVLEKNGFRVITLLINHTDYDPRQLMDSQIETPGSRRFIMPSHLSVWSDLTIYLGLILEYLKVIYETIKYKPEYGYYFLSFENIGSGLSALQRGEVVKFFLQKLRPKCIITTFEGYPWERVIFKVIADTDDRVYRVGYQHSTITKHAHAITRMLREDFDPDLILCSGSVTETIFSNKIKSNHISIGVLGSKKIGGLELKGDSTRNAETCLVLPEGMLEECSTLFNFSCLCAKKLPHINFIWRLHPSLTFDEVFEFMDISLCDIPGNVVVSEGSLSDDIAQSGWALYRGSTSIIDAVFGGLNPIYLADASGMTIDILHNLDRGRLIVCTDDDFSAGISLWDESDFSYVVDYCERYFSRFDATTLINNLARRLC